MLQGAHAADRRRMIEQALSAHVGLNASTQQLKSIFEEWEKPLPIPGEQQKPQDENPDAFFQEGMRLIGGM